MTVSLLDPSSIALIREFVSVYGQELYERLCDRFPNQDEQLISTIQKALYGVPKETRPN